MKRFMMGVVCALLAACNTGGSGDDDDGGVMGFGGAGGGGTPDTAECLPVLYRYPATDMRSTLTLTVDGTDVPLVLEPTRVFGPDDSDLLTGAIPSACSQLTRVPVDGEEWLDMGLWVVFHDGSGTPTASLSRVGGLTILRVRAGGRTYQSNLLGDLPVTAPVRPDVETTIAFDGFEDTVRDEDDFETEVTFQLDGDLVFTTPAYDLDDRARQPVAPLYGCDAEDDQLLEVTADDPQALPFDDSCWDAGNTQSGGGSLRIDFRARPSMEAPVLNDIVPWIITFDMAIPNEGASTLQIVPPDGIVGPTVPGLESGTARSDIQFSLDGVYGPDWVAVDGTIDLTAFDAGDPWPSAEGTFDVVYRYLGPADTAPTLDGDDIRVSGRMIVRP